MEMEFFWGSYISYYGYRTMRDGNGRGWARLYCLSSKLSHIYILAINLGLTPLSLLTRKQDAYSPRLHSMVVRDGTSKDILDEF